MVGKRLAEKMASTWRGCGELAVPRGTAQRPRARASCWCEDHLNLPLCKTELISWSRNMTTMGNGRSLSIGDCCYIISNLQISKQRNTESESPNRSCGSSKPYPVAAKRGCPSELLEHTGLGLGTQTRPWPALAHLTLSSPLPR